MCLVTYMHKPATANKNIHVRKVLIANPDNPSTFLTPFYKEEIVFNNGYCIQSVPTFGIDRRVFSLGIKQGIHSSTLYLHRRDSRKHGIIPKGVAYFASPRGYEMASLKLILFETWWQYFLYKIGYKKIAY